MKQLMMLIGKEVILEWRHMSAFSGIVLYLVSTVFVCYLSFTGVISQESWNALFWIILLFASVNAILRGFVQEPGGRMLYMYTMVSPQTVIMAKIIYNALFMMVLSLIGIGIFVAFMGSPVQHTALFLLNMIAGMAGFSAIMSLVSAIVSKSSNQFTLMGILSFPLVLPLLLVLMRVSLAAISGADISAQFGNLLVVILLASITFVLSVLLFPFIWRE